MTGWEVKTLGEVCDLIARGVAPKYLESGGTCVLNQKCVRDHAVNFDLARRHDHEAKGVAKDRYVRVGDVLVNSTGTGTLGRVAQIRHEPSEPTTVDTHVTIVRPKAAKFFPDFFGYMLIKIEDEIAASGEGASGQTELARSTLAEKFNVSFPTSLDEQRRIVAILDEAFAGLAVMRQHAEANLINARALFDSHLNAIFSQRGDGWVETTIGDQITLQRGFDITKDQQRSGAVPVVSSGGVRSHHDTAMARGPGVIIGRKGSIGSVFYVENDYWPHDTTLWVKDFKENVPRLVFHLLKGIDLKRLDTGTANPALNRNLVHPIKIKWPPANRQKEIVETLESLERKISSLESLYRRKLAAIYELKQSILHRAFSGALIREASTPIAAQATAQPANDNRRNTAMVLALAFARHQRANRDRSFGHVKAQKILHMVEAEAGFDLGRAPRRDAAGPNDFPHMLAAEDWAMATKHFSFSKSGEGYTFKPLTNFDDLTKAARAIEPVTRTRIERVIDLFIPMDMQQSEVFATVYAAWNNLLIEGKPISDDTIINAAREDWHPNKLKIDRVEFVKALHQLRDKNCTPSGQGKFVQPSQQTDLFA